MSITYFFLILLIKSFLFTNSKIVIPFKIRNYKHEKGDKEFILNYFYKDIIINLSVGTPSQPITLSLCLGEYNTFIVSKNCKNYNKGIYNELNSDSYESIGKPELFTFEIFSNGTLAKENINFENNIIENYQFINAMEIGDSCYDAYCEVLTQPGILGFLIQPHANAEMDFSEYNFINQLKKKGLISRYDFYFDFGSNDSGKIVIGSLPNETKPDSYNDTKYSFFSVSKVDFSLDWAFIFDEIYYGEQNIHFEIKKLNILRVEFGFIKASSDMEDYVKKDFFEPLIKAKKCSRESTTELGTSIYYYYCEKDIDLDKFKPYKFTINEFETNFTFTKEDLFLDIGDKYIFLMCFGGSPTIYLGYPFLKKYQFIFNQDSKILAYFHKYIKPIEIEIKPKLKTVYIVIICVLSIVLIGLGVFTYIYFFVMKKKKKNASELSDEINRPNNNEGLIPNEDSK